MYTCSSFPAFKYNGYMIVYCGGFQRTARCECTQGELLTVNIHAKEYSRTLISKEGTLLASQQYNLKTERGGGII